MSAFVESNRARTEFIADQVFVKAEYYSANSQFSAGSEKNASSPLRKNLAFIRQGEYESLPAKLPALPPDYGPAVYSPEISRTGASIIGARNFLIAFNISLNTQEVSLAKEIAAVLVKAFLQYSGSFKVVTLEIFLFRALCLKSGIISGIFRNLPDKHFSVFGLHQKDTAAGMTA